MLLRSKLSYLCCIWVGQERSSCVKHALQFARKPGSWFEKCGTYQHLSSFLGWPCIGAPASDDRICAGCIDGAVNLWDCYSIGCFARGALGFAVRAACAVMVHDSDVGWHDLFTAKCNHAVWGIKNTRPSMAGCEAVDCLRAQVNAL